MAFEFPERLIRTLSLCQDKPAGHQRLVVKVDRKTPSQVSAPALWYSPDGFYFLLVGVLYVCCSFCLRFLKCFSSLQLAARYLQLQKEVLSCPYK